MNDLSMKVYDKVDNKIFNVAAIWFNYEGIKTVQIYGKASPMPQPRLNPHAMSARTPIQRLDRKRIEILMPTGCKDINGNDIYLGDLLTDGLFNLEVTFYNGCFWCGDDLPLWDVVNEDRYEINGNIHIIDKENG